MAMHMATLIMKPMVMPMWFLVMVMSRAPRLLCQEIFAGKLLLPVDDDVHLDSAYSASEDTRNLQPGFYSESLHCVLQQLERNPGIQERAQKHIAAHAGK